MDTWCFIILYADVHYTIFLVFEIKMFFCRLSWKGWHPYQLPHFNRRLTWDIQFFPLRASRQASRGVRRPRRSWYGASSPHSMGSLIQLQSPAIPSSLGFLPSGLGGRAPLGRGQGRGAPPSLSTIITTPLPEDERGRTAWGVNL